MAAIRRSKGKSPSARYGKLTIKGTALRIRKGRAKKPAGASAR